MTAAERKQRKKDIARVMILSGFGFLSNDMWLKYMVVPEDLRGQGIGTAAYKAWERKLPSRTEWVLLHATVMDTGFTGPFWERLGFRYRYDFGYWPESSEPEFVDAHVMVKGVKGHATPKTIMVNDD